MKKSGKLYFLAGVLVTLLASSLTVHSFAALSEKTIQVLTGIEIFVDGIRMNPKDVNGNPVETFVYNGTTYVPLRAIGESFGSTVVYDGENQCVQIISPAGPSGRDAMTGPELAAYAQERTVTVTVTTITNGISTGTGFFIDDQGTLVTNYHVIDMGAAISVQVSNGGSYPVQRVIDFNPVYDLAILKIDVAGNPFFTFSEEPARTGEQVYAVGSALGNLTGSFTSGTVSSISRVIGMIDCIQTDAAISSGNSGGPLINSYGKVLGINSFSFVEGQNLNLAIKPSLLNLLARDKNFSVNEFREWFITESSRSYSPFDGTDYYYSLVNTYQTVTGTPCLFSGGAGMQIVEGYRDMCPSYLYSYIPSQYDQYVSYLKNTGFVYFDSEAFNNGTSYYYFNEKDSILVELFVFSDNLNLMISVTTLS